MHSEGSTMDGIVPSYTYLLFVCASAAIKMLDLNYCFTASRKREQWTTAGGCLEKKWDQGPRTKD